MARKPSVDGCRELAGLNLSLALDKTSTASLYLLINCGLVIELDFHRSTLGGAQRVTACCWVPTKRVLPRFKYEPQDEIVLCSACDEPANFETQHYSLFKPSMARNSCFTAALTSWFEDLGYICLEDTMAALTVQEICEDTFRLLNRPVEFGVSRGHFHWVPSILSSMVGLPVRTT